MGYRKTNWLIVIGLLVYVTGCSTATEIAKPGSGIKTGVLDNAVAIFQQAEKLRAEAVAPKSYQKTRQALDHVNAVIRSDPGNEQAILQATENFAFEADHLLHITNEVNELRSVQSQALENIVLSAEYRLLTISDALKQPDPRRQKLYDQSVTIANAANALASSVSSVNESASDKRSINKNELDDAYTRIKQLKLQLNSSRDENTLLVREEKSLQKRIESLERLVLELNNKNTTLEEIIDTLKSELNKPKPPVQ